PLTLHSFPTRRSSDLVEETPPCIARIAGWIRQIKHRIGAGAEFHALVSGRQKAAAPLAIRQCLRIPRALGHHHHECRQVLTLARSEEHTSELQSPYDL